LGEKFFLDSPQIYKKVIWKPPICPNNFWLFIDYYWNIKTCRFSNVILWNIKENSLENLYKLSQKYILNLKNKECFLANEKQFLPYQIFAKFYDNLWNANILYKRYLWFFKEFWIKKEIKILDLWAGTGNFLNLLKKNWYENFFGIEKSEEMLKIANKKFWKQVVKIWNFENLELKEKFNIITSTFDSLNYITDKEIFTKFLFKIKEILYENWYFIFDINTTKKFKNHFQKVDKFKSNWTEIYYYSSYKKPFRRIKIDFVNKGNIFSESHFEKLLNKKEFLIVLEKIWFEILKIEEMKWRMFLVVKN
jgi:SAM-dependent methyltransferase